MPYRPPSSGLQSIVDEFADLRADYSAAKPSRFKRQRRGLLPYGSGNDYSLRVPTDYYSVVEQARDMDRNDVLIGQMVTRAVENILQDGMRPDPQSGDKGFDSHLRDRWKAWAASPEACDQQAESDFDGLTFLALRQFLVDGDVFPLLLRDGQIQLVEGHRCRSILPLTDNTVLGVELNKSRKAVAYHFADDAISPMQVGMQFGDTRRYPVRDADGERVVCQVMDRRRSSQTRGMSALTPIVDTSGMADDLLFSKLVQSQVASCFAIFHEYEIGSEPAGDMGQLGARSTTPNADGTVETTEALGPGMRIRGKPGEKLQGFSPNVPNDTFFPHIKLIINLISINLGLPLILGLLDASETNFSSWRGAVDQARLGFRRLQNVLRMRFLVPVYRWKVRQWLAEDGVARVLAEAGKLDPLAHKWNRPSWPYIEPLKDAQADSHRLENGLVSPRRLFAENGQEFSEHVVETIDDLSFAIVRAKKRAAAINALNLDDDPVHWRELIYLPMPQGVKTTIEADGGAGFGSSADDAESGDDETPPAKKPPANKPPTKKPRRKANA